MKRESALITASIILQWLVVVYLLRKRSDEVAPRARVRP